MNSSRSTAAAPGAKYIEVPEARHNEFPGLEKRLLEAMTGG
jgi:hypothetical protein